MTAGIEPAALVRLRGHCFFVESDRLSGKGQCSSQTRHLSSPLYHGYAAAIKISGANFGVRFSGSGIF
jgi:hypothetical protein